MFVCWWDLGRGDRTWCDFDRSILHLISENMRLEFCSGLNFICGLPGLSGPAFWQGDSNIWIWNRVRWGSSSRKTSRVSFRPGEEASCGWRMVGARGKRLTAGFSGAKGEGGQVTV